MTSSAMAPVTDLKEYLGAAMHVSVVQAGLASVQHVHGVAGPAAAGPGPSPGRAARSAQPQPAAADPHAGHGRRMLLQANDTSVAGLSGHSSGGEAFGPQVSAEITLPEAGVYVLVGQLRRGEELILAPFYISCAVNSTSTSSAVGAGGSKANAAAVATKAPAAAALAALSLPLLLLLL